MRHRRSAVVPFLALATGLAMAGCGGSSSSSSSASGGASGTSTPTSISVGGGSFCDQTRSAIAQVTQLSHAITPTSPGATPDVMAFKQLIATIASAIDALEGSAPAEIASAFHTFRVAYDKAAAQAQTATTLTDLGNSFKVVGTPEVKAAGTQIRGYLQNTCGITPTPT